MSMYDDINLNISQDTLRVYRATAQHHQTALELVAVVADNAERPDVRKWAQRQLAILAEAYEDFLRQVAAAGLG